MRVTRSSDSTYFSVWATASRWATSIRLSPPTRRASETVFGAENVMSVPALCALTRFGSFLMNQKFDDLNFL